MIKSWALENEARYQHEMIRVILLNIVMNSSLYQGFNKDSLKKAIIGLIMLF
jgi:hypothetical protein